MIKIAFIVDTVLCLRHTAIFLFVLCVVLAWTYLWCFGVLDCCVCCGLITILGAELRMVYGLSSDLFSCWSLEFGFVLFWAVVTLLFVLL